MTRLYLVAGKVTDSVSHGFLPAAARLGLETVLLTDRPADHARAYGAAAPPIVECEVTDVRALVAAIRDPGAIFSNSDHLQAPVALAADYFGLPGKDWRAALRTKNKALMRRHLGDGVFAAEVGADPATDPATDFAAAPYPLVLKPREGVASEDVFLVRDAAELARRHREIRTRRADPLLAEAFLPGALHTLETLGDGRTTRVLGSFRTTISPPPHFVEERLDWAPPPPETGQVLAALERLGVGFGACHTEFTVHAGRTTLVEVNYRVIGDHCDLLLADLLGAPLFEHVLRVHLGEPAPDLGPARGHAVVDYVIADRAGTLAAAPGPLDLADGGVRLTYRPHRSPGETIAHTRTNRDYLGTLRALGPDRTAVEAAVARFRAGHSWEIR
ncbi:siderophore biosynthesis protein [Actinomadura craniellae]|uniref:Siderophore biosynthesis protein n=1 Tax=Actinomadura craniellae TaxID=2231787 RepID=A0A365H2I5_9ACTN|nr:siderophore biosynthesis protein [Actinomadura craniellae]RAY13314.1 siderophore biosynthesis protein [Actinomadura craniellae]